MDKEKVRAQIKFHKLQLQAEWVERNSFQDYSPSWELHEINCHKLVRTIDDLMDSIGERETNWENPLYTSI